MTKVQRFYYVGTGRTDIVHRSYGRMEGGITFCGIYLRSGWKYCLGLRNVPKGSSVCARCEASKQNRYG